MNIFQKISFANRIIKFINNIKKHFETVTVDDKIKKFCDDFIHNIKEFGNLTPELKTEAEYIISEIKKLFGGE